ncbi:restriction endonuclease subunit S [Photobacterium leiognathi]|uniref:restriction endonuclease subunit S n=1 Tax=Photobacterium leiognathi TaxID=553611 RepID=UPI002981F335|nr:restriction endonuclease subunit S [Photobacterium leiognathi]
MSFVMSPLKDLLLKVDKWNPAKEAGDSLIKYIDLSSVDKDSKRIIDDEVQELFGSKAPSRARQLVSEKDILVATVRPNLNGVASVPGELEGATASTGYCVLRVNEELLDSKYLFYWVQTELFVNDMISKASGANYPAVSDKIIKDSKIPLPPLEEQKRIAAILDKADAIRQKRKQAIELADEFLRSVFLDMFGDPVTNPKGFQIGTIRDIVSTVNYGTSGKASEIDGEFPILRMGNITYKGGWDFSDLKYIDLDDKDQGKYLASKNDLLFNRTNSKELVGKTAVFNESKPMAIAGYLIRVRANDLGNPWYISGYLNSSHGKQTLLNMCKSIVGMANINAQELQDIKILLPPVELQNKYESIVKEVNKRVSCHYESLKELQTLFNALSQKAFSGQL